MKETSRQRRHFWRNIRFYVYVCVYVCVRVYVSRLEAATLAAADKCLPRFWQRCTVIQITNNTPPLTFYPTPEDKLQPTWDGRARDYPPFSPLSPLSSPSSRHRASSNYSSWGNRVSWTRLIPVVARPLGRHTELTRRSVFMDQARPDIPRKRRQRSFHLSPFFSLSLSLSRSFPSVCSPRLVDVSFSSSMVED